jgi:hypothetical protein
MKTKMLALFAVLVLSLALAGTAYAAWTTNVTIGGTINTGNLVVTATGTSSSPGVTISNLGSTVTVTVANAYAGETGSVNVVIANTGSLGATLQTFTPPSASSAITWTPTGYIPQAGDHLAAGTNQAFDVSFTVQDAAAQSSSYTFSITLTYAATA